TNAPFKPNGAPAASERISWRFPVGWNDPRQGVNSSEELPAASPPTKRTRLLFGSRKAWWPCRVVVIEPADENFEVAGSKISAEAKLAEPAEPPASRTLPSRRAVALKSSRGS